MCRYIHIWLTLLCKDAKTGPLELGRADALNARTQQYLDVVGILDELLPQGLRCDTSSTYNKGVWTSRQNKWWVGIEHCLHKNFLMIGQPVVEEILTRRLLEECRTSVHYEEIANGISESDEGVALTTDKGRTVHAKYAVGADGARSTIRNTLGIGFEGTKPEMLWAVVDTFIDTDFPECPEIVTFELGGQSRVSWIPRERGMARFYVLLPGGDVTLDRAQDSIKEHMAPHRVDFVKTEWFSTFDGMSYRPNVYIWTSEAQLTGMHSPHSQRKDCLYLCHKGGQWTDTFGRRCRTRALRQRRSRAEYRDCRRFCP